MDSTARNETSMRDEEVKKFKELSEIVEKLIGFLIGVMTLKPTKTMDDFFTEHSIVASVSVLMIALFFMVWMLRIMLQDRAEWVTMIFEWIILLIGSICSVSVLATIYPVIAFFTAMLWVGIFGVTACCCYQNLHELFVCSVSDAIKKLIESCKLQSTRVPA